MWCENIRSPSFSFVTIHASDGQTDGRTDGLTELRQQYRALHYTQSQSHGKMRRHTHHSSPSSSSFKRKRQIMMTGRDLVKCTCQKLPKWMQVIQRPGIGPQRILSLQHAACKVITASDEYLVVLAENRISVTETTDMLNFKF